MAKIFGYDWEDIQAMQNKQYKRKTIDPIKPVTRPLLKGDLELYEKHGFSGLQAMGYDGVIDRLRFNGVIKEG